MTRAANALNQVSAAVAVVATVVAALAAGAVGTTVVDELALAIAGDLERERGRMPPSAEKQGKPKQPTPPRPTEA